jgi:hypothetical protein
LSVYMLCRERHRPMRDFKAMRAPYWGAQSGTRHAWEHFR